MGGVTPKLSKSAIENIFQLRVDGKSFREIASRYPCSDHFINQVITREQYAEVEIDAGLVHGAQNMKRAKPKKRTAKKPEPMPEPIDKYGPLSRLMAAQAELMDAYRSCRAVGLSEAFLDLALDEVGALRD